MITKIETIQTTHTMGETTEDQAVEFCNHLKQRLNDQYPDAEVSVKFSTRQSSTTLYVECSTDEEGYPTEMEPESTVQEFINYVWERWC